MPHFLETLLLSIGAKLFWWAVELAYRKSNFHECMVCHDPTQPVRLSGPSEYKSYLANLKINTEIRLCPYCTAGIHQLFNPLYIDTVESEKHPD